MAWVRLHDGAMTNPKIDALSDSAFRLWVNGLCYCQSNLTDGLITRGALRILGAKRKDVEQLTRQLAPEYAPLWETHDVGFKVHDYLFWNDSREKVQERQQKARDRLEKWRRDRSPGNGNGVTNGVSNGARNGDGNATTTKPNLTKPKLEERIRGACRDSFERFWAIYPKHSGRLECERWWGRLNPTEEFAATIATAADRYRKSVIGIKAQYVKAPIRWLEGGHWDDELPRAEAVVVPVVPAYRCPHEPPCDNGRWACQRRTEIDAYKAQQKAEA